MASKRVKKEQPEANKVSTKSYKLKKDYLTDKGLLKAGQSITLGAKGAKSLKFKNII